MEQAKGLTGFHYFLLFISIALESVGVNFLKLADGFTVLIPTLIAITCYLSSIAIFIYLTARGEIGILVALFAGLGTAIVAITGIILYGESFTLLKIIGVGLIIFGAVAINVNIKSPKNEEATL